MRFFLLLILTVLALTGPAAAASLVDANGQTVEVAKPFSRIISLYSAHTENLATLGAEAELIGISTSDDFPPEVLDKPRFSFRDDPEKFMAARPDLVLVRPMIERSYPQLIDKLRQVGISVVSLQPTSVEEIVAYWQALGLLCGRPEQAAAMEQRFRHEISEIGTKLAKIPNERRKRVYFEAIHTKMKTFAPESIAIYVLEQAGGINVAADAPRVRETNIAYYGKERILAKGSEIDLFLAQQGRMNPVEISTITGEPGFDAIAAIRAGHIHLVDERLVSRPTLRIVEGVRQVAGILYPDLFGAVGEATHGR